MFTHHDEVASRRRRPSAVWRNAPLPPTIGTGAGAVKIKRMLSNEGVYNDVLVIASGTAVGTPAQGEVFDTNTGSPTYYLGKYAVVASLNNPDKTKGAAIYVMENDKVISTILPKEELGLTNFMHIHNAVLRQVGKKLYIIAQAWNPGDFAILEQVQ